MTPPRINTTCSPTENRTYSTVYRRLVMSKRLASEALGQPPSSPKRAKLDDTFASTQRPPRTISKKRPASNISGGEEAPKSYRTSKRIKTSTDSNQSLHNAASPLNIRQTSSPNEHSAKAAEASYWQRRTREINQAFEAAELRSRRARRTHAAFRIHRLPSPLSDEDTSLDIDRHRIVSEVFDFGRSDRPGSRMKRLATAGVALQPGRQEGNIWCPPVFDPDWSPVRAHQPTGRDARTNKDRARTSQHKHPTRELTGTDSKTSISRTGTASITRSTSGKIIQQSRRPDRQLSFHRQRGRRRQESLSSQREPTGSERQRNPGQTSKDTGQVRRSTRGHNMDNIFYELDSRGNPRSVLAKSSIKQPYSSDFS